MQKAMKKLGIQQQEIEAVEVVIKCTDKTIVVSNPSVSKVNMMGQETFQISGEISEKSVDSTPEIKEEDIQTVMDQANVSKEVALQAIKDNNGDLAKAIMSLSE